MTYGRLDGNQPLRCDRRWPNPKSDRKKGPRQEQAVAAAEREYEGGKRQPIASRRIKSNVPEG